MRRLLVLGDVHIGDYPRYNGVVNRLGQFNTLANRLCDLESDDDISISKDVIIAGDLLLSCVMKPKAIHAVKDFIDKLCYRFDNVYYILGNHDVDIKLKKFGGLEDETLITLMDSIPNFHYMHDKHAIIEGVDFYFTDWIHSSEVEVKDKCDIFISHINLMPKFGQQVDNSKFKLGIFGDYHSRIQVDNMITTGTPIQHYISDPVEPGIIILDVDNGNFNWKRIPIETKEYKFLKIYKEDNAPRALGKFDVVVKNKKIEKKPEFEKLKVSLDSKLDSILEENGLSDIHSKVLSVTGDIEPIDMNFELKKLDILNFRSINELHVKFEDGKLIFLNGANGSGKTSFITALKVALFGDRSIKKYIRHGCDYTEVGVELLYQGRIHSIVRAPGYLSYKIDDQVQDANNMASMQSSIEKNLPFLSYLNDFLINSHTTFFSSCNRLGLISRLFGLDRYSMYAQEASKQKNQLDVNKRNELNVALSASSSTIESNENLIKDLSSKIPVIDERYSGLNIRDIESKINKLSFNLSKCQNLMDKIKVMDLDSNTDLDKLKSKIEELTNTKVSITQQIDDIARKISDIDALAGCKSSLENLESIRKSSTHTTLCPKCGEVVCFDSSSKDVIDNIQNLKVKIEDLSSSLVNCDKESLTTRLKEFEIKKNELTDEIAKLTNLLSNYKLKSEYEVELKSLVEFLGDLESTKNTIDELTKVKSDLITKDGIESSLTNCKNILESERLKKSSIETELNNIEIEVDKYNKYLSMFSFSNRDGIPYQTLNMVVDSISDEEITFTTDKELNSGKVQFRVSCMMNVDGNDLDFDVLSDGQQAFVSLKILSKLSRCLPGLGLVMLDEPFKHVDEGRINQCIDLLKDIQSNTIILSSHSPSFNYADRVLTFSLNNGVTNVSEEI